MIERSVENGMVEVRLGQIHSKIFLLENDGRRIVCGGSANWNRVRRVEDARVEDNELLYAGFSDVWDRLWAAAGAIDVRPVGAVKYMRGLVDLDRESRVMSAVAPPTLDVV